MYKPAHFVEHDPAQLHSLVETWPLGLLITQQSQLLCADPIPFLIQHNTQGEQWLVGHIAKANPIAKIPNHSDVLVVFSGPSHYVSPHWYPSKQNDPKVVPTYNYALVQVRGPLEFITEPPALLNIVTLLTNRFEDQASPQREPWKVSDAPSDYIDKMLAAIIGIRIPIRSFEGKFKASQNRSPTDREGVRVERIKQVGEALTRLSVREPTSSNP
jgi:transcriptional regulator